MKVISLISQLASSDTNFRGEAGKRKYCREKIDWKIDDFIYEGKPSIYTHT